ncbi:2-oxoacid:acceptor oxidoreductase, alpha subunit [Caldisphaera lagunensis DSM 15908]|uniref:2-oxoacid oxidoreductase (ferredoxin) n=1 Tax=Caldisphaera lagunensis (strain DSM 15908 / JCM 11604 / ANMR 0165 / IC-154) TaxID=1056495 RepID=L0A9N2_CALLD|nr:2-oxoacid:ferredoxin oxidoreductase subunit alpha [Caldisphaera lagunensis]AFZ70109.1 2-oxoacid:acceptor oxidoreductase, alpha subunit [Caldisphaera lagunensis DSM 15908]
MNDVDISVMIGGPQGGGIESSGQMLVRTFMIKGYDVFGIREYHSNIMGAHSYYNVRIKKTRPRSVRLPVDGLIALDAETIFTHYNEVSPNSFIIYDIDVLNTNMDKIAPMEPEVKERIGNELKKLGVEPIVSEVIKYLSNNGIKTVGLPLKNLLKTTAEKLKTNVVSVAKTVNTMSIAASVALLGVDVETIEKSINYYFYGRKAIIDSNVMAARIAYDFVKDNFGIGKPIDDGPNKNRTRMVATGNDIVAMGKLAGGLTLETYYPITPSQDEAFYLGEHRHFKLDDWAAKELGVDKLGVLVFQAEDELAALNMAIGGALAGARTATTTSGPGLSLMNEAISFAVMAEVPVVITVWMRAGPSTGEATRQGQQDLLHSVFAGHGDTPKIVIASGDHIEAYYDAMKALNWAEKYQTPVIHLVDKYIASSMMSFDREDVDPQLVPIDRGKFNNNQGEDYKRYEITDDYVSPRSPLGKRLMWVSSLTHNEYGIVTEDPITREKMLLKIAKKIENANKEIPINDKVSLYGDQDAKITIVTWGSAKGPILDAMELLKKEGINTRLLQIRMMSPFPSEYVSNILNTSELVIDVEANALSQLAMLIRMNTGYEIKKRIIKLTGRSIMEHELYRALKSVIQNKQDLVVISDGA